MAQESVFIAHNPADEAEKEALLTHLGVLQRQGLIETWTDDQIRPGTDWAAEMEGAINRARVAILLITSAFLSSEFVRGPELARILERRQANALIVYPIIARPCAWQRVPWLARMVPPHTRPVWRDGGRHVDEELAAIAEQIAEIMEKSAPAGSQEAGVTLEHTGRSGTRTLVFGDGEPPALVSQIKNRYALLIGVRDYAAGNFRPLPHTLTDVIELDKVLRAAGYLTKLLHSDLPNHLPTFSNIWGELESLAQLTGPGDLLLVYFGGHGALDEEGNAYLVPGDLRSQAALKRTGINLDDFTQAIINSQAQARILILDACHSGIDRSTGGMDPAFERRVFLEATGSATLAACRRGQVAYDHDQTSHGVFTYYLLKGLRGDADRQGKGFVTFNDLQQYVTDGVKHWAFERSWQQWPNANSKLVGDPPLLTLARQKP